VAGKVRKMASSSGQMLNHQEIQRIPQLNVVKVRNLECALCAGGKFANAVKEMQRLRVDIIEISQISK